MMSATVSGSAGAAIGFKKLGAAAGGAGSVAPAAAARTFTNPYRHRLKFTFSSRNFC
jgi:hypothetical protein